MSKAVINEHHFLFEGVRYWTTNASEAVLGAYGRLVRRPLMPNRFEVQSELNLKDLSIREATTVEIDYESSSNAGVQALLQADVVGMEAGTKVNLAELKSGRIVLVRLDLKLDALKRAMNNQSEHLEVFRQIPRTPRVVSTVFVVMQFTQASRLIGGAEINVNAPLADGSVPLEVALEGDGAHNSMITLSKGSTFAFMLAAPRWNMDETEVAMFDKDSWSMMD